MSTIYNGEPDNTTNHSSWAIASSTNPVFPNPVVITTTNPHDILEGDHVVVRNHATNVSANGIWSAHVIDGSNIALYAVVGLAGLSGAVPGTAPGGNTGTIQALGLLPNFTIPSDTDAPTAASVNVGLEASADVWQFCAEHLGSHRVVWNTARASTNIVDGVSGGATGTTAPAAYLNTVNSTTAVRLGTAGATGVLSGVGMDFFPAGAANIPDVLANDVVEVSLSVSVNADTSIAGHGPLYLGLSYELFEEGTAQTNVFTGKIPATSVYWKDGNTGPLILSGKFVVPSTAGRFKKLQVYMTARTVSGSTPIAVQLDNDVLWQTRITRPNGIAV
ncbi:MAG: hypothetical protein NVS3B10_00010 [Polyangiales bacterium]